MHAFVKTKRSAALAILIILSLNLLVLSFLPRAFAAVHPVFTISPNKGYVGETVSVNGSFLTPGGKYTIFFDNKSVTNGDSNGLGNFTNTFVVPPAVNGTHTIKLQDITSNTNATVPFTIITKYYINAVVPAQPQRLQEGSNVTISARIVGGNSNATYYPLNVTVTTPAKTVYYNATLPLTTDSNGTANGTLSYPTDFEPTNASNTSFNGTYLLQLFYKNVTTPKAQSSFFIGLTNATLYHRLDWVNVKAANYTEPSENATVTIKFGNTTIASQKTSATNGTVTYNWQVPVNASEGSYMVTVTAISGPNKKVPDAQNFTVPGLLVSVETTNLNGMSVAKVIAAVYKTVKGNQTLVASSYTNSSGRTATTLTQGGNYTLKAYYEAAQVNTTNIYVTENSSWTLTCQITNIEFMVKDNTPKHNPLPLVLLNVTVAYKTFENVSQTAAEDNLTNTAGEGIFLNQLVIANYTVRAYRAPYQAQLLFNTTKLTTVTQVINRNITIICPLLNLTIHAEDAKNALLAGYPVQIYEFLGGLYNYSTTDTSGDVTFSATFGEYQVRLYNLNETILLNETYYNLVNASAFLLMRSDIYHANLSVTVLDYFGLPVPNINVELERDGVPSITLKTNGKGVALFDGITGGNCYISISTGSGSPIATANVSVKGNAATTVTLGNYVSILGLLVGTTQFAVLLTFVVFIVVLLFFLLYRRRSKASEETGTEKKS